MRIKKHAKIEDRYFLHNSIMEYFKVAGGIQGTHSTMYQTLVSANVTWVLDTQVLRYMVPQVPTNLSTSTLG